MWSATLNGTNVVCSQQSCFTFVCAAGVYPDTQGDVQTLKDTKKGSIRSSAKLITSEIQRANQAAYKVLMNCAKYANTFLKFLSTMKARTNIFPDTVKQFCFFLFELNFSTYRMNPQPLHYNQFDSASNFFRSLQM